MGKVDLDLPVVPVIGSFGSWFLKYFVNEKGSSAGRVNMTKMLLKSSLPLNNRYTESKCLTMVKKEIGRTSFTMLGSTC